MMTNSKFLGVVSRGAVAATMRTAVMGYGASRK
jgi:hypothetical protein